MAEAPSYGMPGAAEVLRRRGVLRSTRSRYATPDSLDADAIREVEAVLEFLEPYLRWPPK